MFSTVYFAASSVLACDGVPAALAARVLDGQLNEAVHLAASLADSDHAHDEYTALQIHADLELALGRHEEAEETYRKTQKAVRHSRDAMRVVSVRNAGWQACFRNQFHVALTCFRRVAEERCATPAQQLDSLIGATLVLFHLGCVQAACDRLAELAPLAAAHPDTRWTYLVEMLRRDLLAQHELHDAEPLGDHIYWRSVVTGSQTALGAPAVLAAGLSMPLLDERLAYLGHLKSFAAGHTQERSALKTYASWSRKAGLADYHRSLCLEMALGAIAAHATAAAEELLEQSGAAALHGSQNARWYLDYLYCRAKIMQQQMRTQEFATLYGRYALASIQHVRADSVSLPAAAPEAAQSRSTPRADDVSARLPAKYRRAYRYLMDHLDQKDLSVREVASQIGVTERAMQGAFRKHLGLSPSELIRRQRMERIRDELLDDDAPVARVLDVAKKWGVQHRSTLINGYRSVFNEAPSQTMGR
ncbi:helix-turn-helix transcriptional regulator [Paraburkholderia acidicola]|uniref:Helix-turn-helix transcriptional regulator n=1 Tax=Paraburkholderia acidicola TaxID=1912599 RepID=A0ABV1LUX0_9BURK